MTAIWDKTATAAPLSLAQLSVLAPETLSRTLGSDAGHTAQWAYAAACLGLVEAQTALGQMLLDGRGTPADGAAARRWFGRAAQAGYAPAANMLGRCLERAWGGSQDYAGAAEWYRRAAEAGLDWGQYNLANMLLRGRGVPRDIGQSYAWFTAAAGQGHAKSMNLVGRFLEEGWLGTPDIRQALIWYRCAAEGGDFRGQYNLATLLALTGAVEDAIPWFVQAGEAGSLDFRRVAAEQLLARSEPGLRQVGLTIAAACCRGGAGEDYHRYGRALAQGDAAQLRQARAWLRLATAAGHHPAEADLAALDAALDAAPPRWLDGVVRRLVKPRSGLRGLLGRGAAAGTLALSPPVGNPAPAAPAPAGPAGRSPYAAPPR